MIHENHRGFASPRDKKNFLQKKSSPLQPPPSPPFKNVITVAMIPRCSVHSYLDGSHGIWSPSAPTQRSNYSRESMAATDAHILGVSELKSVINVSVQGYVSLGRVIFNQVEIYKKH